MYIYIYISLVPADPLPLKTLWYTLSTHFRTSVSDWHTVHALVHLITTHFRTSVSGWHIGLLSRFLTPPFHTFHQKPPSKSTRLVGRVFAKTRNSTYENTTKNHYQNHANLPGAFLKKNEIRPTKTLPKNTIKTMPNLRAENCIYPNFLILQQKTAGNL